MNWKWPQSPDNRLYPWYTIARHLIFYPVAVLGAGILWVGLALGWGLDEANRFIKENF